MVVYDISQYLHTTVLLDIEFPPVQYNLEEVARDRESKIDSTGNLLWPAEELLSKCILSDAIEIPNRDKIRILELGAGFSGIAGLSAALKAVLINKSKEVEVLLTDGNETCAQCNT